jgi:hypothetical protein
VDRLAADHDLEPVLIGRIVRSRHHDAGVAAMLFDREIQHTRWPEPDWYRACAPDHQTGDQRIANAGDDSRPSYPTATFDRPALAPPLRRANPSAHAS